MKKKISLILVISFIFGLLSVNLVSASSANYNVNSSDAYIKYLDDGSYLVIEFEQNDDNGISLLSTNIGGSKTITHYNSSNEALCALKLTATFSYDGTEVSCVGTKCTKYSYDSSWSVENVTTSHSSTSTTKASATGNADFIKRILGIKAKTVPVSTTIYCDKNGNLS